MLLSLKVLKAVNAINKHFKISNYENKFSKWPPLNYLKLSTHVPVNVIKRDILIRMKDFALLKCSKAHNFTNASYMLVCIRQILFSLINDGIQNGYQSRKVLTHYFSFSFLFILTSCFSKF